MVAPGVFRLDDRLELAYETTPSPDMHEPVQEAVRMCPMQAITVDEG